MRFCTSCGAQLDDNDAFCTSCGASAGAPADPPAEQPKAEETRIVVDDYGYENQAMGSSMGSASVEPYPIDPAATGMPRTGTVMAQDMVMDQGMPVPPGNMGYGGANANMGTGPTAYRTQTQTGAQGNGKGMYVIIGVAAAVIVAAIAIIVVMFVHPPAASATISFETNGGSAIEDKSVDEGQQVRTPTDPIKDGYSFDGWYTDSNFTNKVTFPFTPDGDMTLYAKWTEKGDSGDAGGTTTGSGSTVAGNNGGTTSSKETVTIRVTGSDGSVQTADIHRDKSSQRVFPDSNSRRLSTSEVASLSDAERCIAWNEIIAASNGYAFKNGGLADYFSRCSWYSRNPGASAGGNLSEAGSANVELLQSYTSSWWKSLATY